MLATMYTTGQTDEQVVEIYEACVNALQFEIENCEDHDAKSHDTAV